MTLAIRPRAKHQCRVCGRSFSRPCSLQSHLDKHFDIRRFECQFCQKPFRRKNDLNVHIKEQHSSGEISGYACRQANIYEVVEGCDKVFKRKSLLLRHLRSVKGRFCHSHPLDIGILNRCSSDDACRTEEVKDAEYTGMPQTVRTSDVHPAARSLLPLLPRSAGVHSRMAAKENRLSSLHHCTGSILDIRYLPSESMMEPVFVTHNVVFNVFETLRRERDDSSRQIIQYREKYSDLITVMNMFWREGSGFVSLLCLCLLGMCEDVVSEECAPNPHIKELARRLESNNWKRGKPVVGIVFMRPSDNHTFEAIYSKSKTVIRIGNGEEVITLAGSRCQWPENVLVHFCRASWDCNFTNEESLHGMRFKGPWKTTTRPISRRSSAHNTGNQDSP